MLPDYTHKTKSGVIGIKPGNPANRVKGNKKGIIQRLASYVTEGIITGCRRYGEADRLLTIFTLEKGRISAIAKSSRKAKSSLSGASEAFVRAKYEMAEGKSLDILRQAEVIDPHLGIRESWTRLQFAGHVAEIVNKMSVERMPDEFLYRLLSDTLESISLGNNDAVMRFKASLLNHMGVFPDLSGCVKCGCGKAKGHVHLATAHSGFLCDECAKELQIWHPVPMTVLHVLHGLRNGNEVEVGDEELIGSVDDILTTLLQAFLQQGFKTTSATRHARKSACETENKGIGINDNKSGDKES